MRYKPKTVYVPGTTHNPCYCWCPITKSTDLRKEVIQGIPASPSWMEKWLLQLTRLSSHTYWNDCLNTVLTCHHMSEQTFKWKTSCLRLLAWSYEDAGLSFLNHREQTFCRRYTKGTRDLSISIETEQTLARALYWTLPHLSGTEVDTAKWDARVHTFDGLSLEKNSSRHNKNCYLIEFNCHWRFLEILHLLSTTSTQDIQKLKLSFTRFGIPDEVVSYNGPHFLSLELHKRDGLQTYTI